MGSFDEAVMHREVASSKHLSVGVKKVEFQHEANKKAHVHIDLDLMPTNMSGEEVLTKISELVHNIGKIEL
ncbi:hypothetical protein [Ligilactobacillus acidipiscis]|uniref:hypothetical protein n=1 Tax=Ligilactobacillus acidipiscis TaxID=89059 RepID=UPI0023F87B0F|nr:hypothetical protein [Ligilactobacillus acidipiscis]WEV56138.1 hypothetical protein OZX66_07730 [Ligilactobacillus acidipiscis]